MALKAKIMKVLEYGLYAWFWTSSIIGWIVVLDYIRWWLFVTLGWGG